MNSRSYCTDPFQPAKRETREVPVGKIGIGGPNPIRVQSMLTCDTMDTGACVRETLELVAAGCEIVRITAPTRKDAANLENIREALRSKGCDVPLVADIHFKPDAAMEAAKWVEKVRINPGNYADKKKFQVREYTDEQYSGELEKLKEAFLPLVDYCREANLAMRIGTNHGSLSDRIMNRYGDTPLGMVESALEFARIARSRDYHAFVFSMKASNPKVMIAAYRLLAARLFAEGPDWNYPLHLGVTEAGDGEDGRIKSAIGIGSLLMDGIGDTVRVSLTEDSVQEIPVAKALVRLLEVRSTQSTERPVCGSPVRLSFDPYSYSRRKSHLLRVNDIALGDSETIRVAASRRVWEALAHKLDALGDYRPELVAEECGILAVDPREEEDLQKLRSGDPRLVTVKDGLPLPVVQAFRLLAARIPEQHPILLKDTLHPNQSSDDFLENLIIASANIGSLICDGIGDAVLVQGEKAPGQSLRLAYNILQASGARIFKTDYVACPSCGRTLFNLQSTTAKIKAATLHLKGVKIAIMGCIVNGPGEMADADFGYVGGAPGKVNLYVGKTPVRFNIPEEEAVDRLVDLIKEHGRWVEPAAPVNS